MLNPWSSPWITPLKCIVIFHRFKNKQKIPENLEGVKALHEDIQIARVPRQCAKKIEYAYVEFGTEAKLEDAKVRILGICASLKRHRLDIGWGDLLPQFDLPNKKEVCTLSIKMYLIYPMLQLSIEKNDSLYVDYVGIKSKAGGKPKHQRGGKGRNIKQINPTRLFISGLIDGMTEEKLKLLFPKCRQANITKGSIRKGTLYGFVQFSNPADAKSAFEAAKKLTVQTQEGKEGQRITVLYASATKHPITKKTDNPGKYIQNR